MPPPVVEMLPTSSINSAFFGTKNNLHGELNSSELALILSLLDKRSGSRHLTSE